MMVAPLIGINGRRTPIEEFSKYPKVMAGRDASLYWSDYARGVAEAGACRSTSRWMPTQQQSSNASMVS